MTVTSSADVRFIADLAQRMRWEARTSPGMEGTAPRASIASGTLDALLWALNVSDLCPASGKVRRSRSAYVIEVEAQLAEQLRAGAPVGSDDAFYLGGVADALDFVLGKQQRFWWVPIPEALRPGRDDYGRAVA